MSAMEWLFVFPLMALVLLLVALVAHEVNSLYRETVNRK